ncbi:hypothetical protein FRC07_006439 [Ceratobasidium sp. 392]|nr:hypothetical protein FRC07_006439 [Ceratobasidium sp. 392]
MEENKKRKLEDTDDSTTWNKAKAEAFVKDVGEIQEAIKYSDAYAFTENLAASLNEASTKTVQLVKELLTPILLDGSEDSRHCVRCHKDYTEKDNHGAACIIRCCGKTHSFVLKTMSPAQPYVMMECCGEVFKSVSNWKYSNLICIEDRHTDDPSEVVYFDPGRGQGADDGKPKNAEPLPKNNPNVLPCAVKGCVKKYYRLENTASYLATNMTEENKKRKLDDEELIPWNKAKAEAFVKDVEELQEAIKYADANAFTENLADSLNEASMKTVQLVKELVTPILLDGYDDPRHCARCHESYTERDNHASACIILCSGKLHSFALKMTPMQPYVLMECCGRIFKHLSNWKYSELTCTEERHTDNPDEVLYYDPSRRQGVDDGKPKDAIPLEKNNPNVVACAVKGCGKKS